MGSGHVPGDLLVEVVVASCLSLSSHAHTHLSVLTFNSEHIAHAMAVAAAVRLIPELGMQQLWLLQLSRC